MRATFAEVKDRWTRIERHSSAPSACAAIGQAWPQIDLDMDLTVVDEVYEW